ncbi:MAG: Hsp20/alpha crystallin family protein [Hyphomicrobiaceae bacterium]|nr:Hsp20/alpha crystallin family protein [Hyphomicrobiaceae bacterium]
MVERTQTGGWMPSLYEPIKKASQKIAEWFAPRSDAAVTPVSYEIEMELPGVQPEDIDIQLQDGMLVVTGEKRFEHTEEGRSYLFSEREYGAFQRAFRIPPDADPEAIDAQFKHGILTLRLPKLRPAEGPSRKIAIRSA